LPRKYLRGFCEPGSDSMLWQFDKMGSEWSRVSIATAANERGFYSRDVEQKLANYVEAPANVALDKLRSGHSIDNNDRHALAVYIAVMLKRVPAYREFARELAPQIAPGALASTAQEVRSWIRAGIEEGHLTPEIGEARLAEADAIEERFKKEIPPQVWEQIRIPWPSIEMVSLVFHLTWRFVQTKGRSFFITSDNPAFIFKGLGLRHARSELVFPVCSELALHGNWQTGPQNVFVPAEVPNHRQVVHAINRRVACGATRFIYYRAQATWIPDLAKNNQESLGPIVWL
jgi:Protein of unknown function (DUF4238)